ncbi:MAG TPA: oligosaccharide flippase family protein [Acetobacteraceae bacterium]|jgi:O-antigen/teichoic acid export membrane protein|nr:oligosaccharide flippase family protein [Acetobacteraceae bacterium]
MSRMRQKVRSSVAWATLEGFVNILAAICMTLVVGRIIGPTEFGIAAIAWLVGTFAEIFVTTPFVDPLIQRRGLNKSAVNAAFTAMLAVGVLVYLILLGSAGFLARLYDKSGLVALLAVQGTTCLFAGMRGVPEAIMSRKLRFNQLAVRNIVAKIASAVVSLIAAMLGMGAWSVILGNVAYAFGTTAIVLSMTKRMPRFAFHMEHLARLSSFGIFVLLEALLWGATPRLFSFFVGYFQGLQALGQLSIAFRMNDTVFSLIYVVANRLALPMLSRVAESTRRVEQTYVQGTKMVGLIVAPLFLGLALISRELADVVLGPNWPLAAPSLMAVSLFSLLNSTRLVAQPTVKAVGRPSLLIGPDVIGLIYIAAGSFILRNAGFDAALSVWISFGIIFVICSLRMVQNAIGTGWLTQLAPLAPAFFPSLGMCGVLLGLDMLHLGLPLLVMLVLKIALGASTYLLLLVVLERPLLIQLLSRSKPAAG